MPDEIRNARPLLPEHRDVLLELILAWATLDGALGALLGRTLGISPYDAAEQYGKCRASQKLAHMIRHIKHAAEHSDNAARVLKMLRSRKKKYEKLVNCRNRVAHAHCAGYIDVDGPRVVFAVFEREGSEGLAVEAISIEHMRGATQWANSFARWVLRVLDEDDARRTPMN